MKKVLFALLVVFIVSCTQMSEAATIRVPDDFSTIQEAVNNSSFGDIIAISDGIYEETIILRPGIILLGQSKENTIIDSSRILSPANASEPNTIITLADNCQVHNLTLRHLPSISISTVLSGILGDHVSRCTINNVKVESKAAITFLHSANIVLTNTEGYHDGLHHLVIFSYCVNSQIIRCAFVNAGSGTTLGIDNSERISLFASDILANHTVLGGTALCITDSSETIIMNSILLCESRRLSPLYSWRSTGNLSYSCLYGSEYSTDGLLNIEHLTIIQDNPLLVNSFEDPYDLRLMPGSACIDAGNPAYVDYDCSRSDIGYYGGYFDRDHSPCTPEEPEEKVFAGKEPLKEWDVGSVKPIPEPGRILEKQIDAYPKEITGKTEQETQKTISTTIKNKTASIK